MPYTARPCAVCGQEYRPKMKEQRTCSRSCGVAYRRGVTGTIPAPRTRVAWRQCAYCPRWYTAVGKRRCDCRWGGYERRGTTSQRPCKQCGVAVAYEVATRPPDYCTPCRAELLAQRRRDGRKRRKALQRGVQTEPVNVQRVYERDRWRCGLCHRRVDPLLRYPHAMSASLDHVVPLAHGGAHSMANVQLAHLQCNLDKRDGGGQQLALLG